MTKVWMRQGSDHSLNANFRSGFHRIPTLAALVVFFSATAILEGAVLDRSQIGIGPNVRVTQEERNECWIVASATNPDFLVAVSQTEASNSLLDKPRNSVAMLSRDGGRTWEDVKLPKYEAGAFDPVAAAAPDGRIYVVFGQVGQDFDELAAGVKRAKGGIRVWSTADEGKTWEGPTEIEIDGHPDHPRIIVDNSDSKYRGRVYVVWNTVGFPGDKYAIYLHYSEDAGKTFSKAIEVCRKPDGKLVTTESAVLSDGTLLVAYFQYFFPAGVDPRNDHMGFYLSRSTDGGQTFHEPIKVMEFGPWVWRFLISDFRSPATNPLIITDTSKKSKYRDNLYLVWDDVHTGFSNIQFIRSTDKGKSWSKPLFVNDNPPQQAEGPRDRRNTPAIAVNKDGVIGVAWYDRRNDPTKRCWEYFFAASSDGGVSFGRNIALSTATSCPAPNAPPNIHVHNLTPPEDMTLPPEVVSKMGLIEKLMYEYKIGAEEVRREAEREIRTGRISVAFNPSRSIFPGDYTGLAASPDGVFHPLWADRRNGLQQLYTTRVNVLDLPPTVPVTKEADVTGLAEVIAGPASFDEAKGTIGFDLQLHNVSKQMLYGPITLRVSKILQTAAGPGMEFLNAKDGPDPEWTFAGKLGSRNRLEPKDISEPIRIEAKTSREAGLDAAFDFAVMGNVSKEAVGSVKVLVDTELGEIELEIDAGRAPLTATNFLKYVDGRYFDGGLFVRTLTAENQRTAKTPIEVIQAVVAPTKDKEAFPAIALERTSLTGLKHLDGTVSAARGATDSATSSFFICIGDQPALDVGGSRNLDGQGFAAFGKVIRGMDIVRKIQMARAQGEELTPPIRIVRIARE